MNFPKLIASLVTLPAIMVSAVYGSAAVRSDQEPAKQSSPSAAAELRYKAPGGWLSEQPSSKMRVAQYKLPRAEGDSEDASLVLYYFGPEQGGSVQANVDRWIGQMKQPATDADKPKMETLTINRMKITMVDAEGTYTAEMSPGSGTFYNKPNYRLRAAIVETPKGSYFAKLVGPAKTVRRWEQSYMDYLRSFEFK